MSPASADEGFVDILSADPSSYPTIGLNIRVDTDAGLNGKLTKEDFSVYEGGEKQPITGFEFSSTTLDLVFVFDDTGSMGGEIAAMKRQAKSLTEKIAASDIDARYALVSYKDDVEIDLPFTDDPSSLKNNVDLLRARGGGDFPEDNFDAVETALGLAFRESAQKVIVDITDALSHYRGDGSGISNYTLPEVAADLKRRGVVYIAVSPGFDDPRASKKVLARKTGGLWIDIYGADFDQILKNITKLIIQTYVLEYETRALPGTVREIGVSARDPNLGLGSTTGTVTIPEDVGPALPLRFEELCSAKLELAGQIDDISQSIVEQPMVEMTLDDLANGIERGDVEVSRAISAVQRMILGEDLTELSLAGLNPVAVSSPEDSDSRVGEPSSSPAAKDSFNIAGALVGNTLQLAVGVLFALAGLKSVVAWLSKFTSRADDAIDFLNTAITTIFGAIPFIDERIEDAANLLSGQLEEKAKDGETDGEDLYESVAGDVENLIDPFTNEIMAELEGGFETNLEVFDRDLGLNDDGVFAFEGDDAGALEAAATARREIIASLEQVKNELEVTGFVSKVAGLMAIGGAFLSVTGIFTAVGTALGILGAFFSLSFTFLGCVSAADGLFTVRGFHNSGLDAIVQGGV